MESDTLIGEDPKTNGGYNTVSKAGVTGPKFTKKTVLGEVRNWKRFSWLEWVFVVVAALTILVILGISIERFVSFKEDFVNITLRNNKLYKCNNWRCTNDFIFTVVLVLNIAFSALYVMVGLLRERMFALVAYGATIIAIMLYVIANYVVKSERGQLTDPLRLARLVLILVGGPINIILSSLISWRMGYFIFTTVGGNTTLIRAYKIRSFLLILHVMLLQVMANVLALSWSRDGKFISTGEKVAVCVLLAYCVLVMLLGWGTVMFEKHWLVPLWYLLLAPYIAYFVFKIVNVAVNFGSRYKTKVIMYTSGAMEVFDTDFKYIGLTLLVACMLGLVIVALLFVFMALTLHNFKKGLRDKAPPPTDVWLALWQRTVTRLGMRPPLSPLA